jgi:6-phosphofructokinase 2
MPARLIVTLTVNPSIDESASVDQVVADRKLRCGTPHYEPGGGGINVARALHRLGGQTLAIYAAGGSAGDLVRSLLAREGVPQTCLPIGSWTRENLNVLEESTGRQFRFVFSGGPLTECEWKSLLEAIDAVRPVPSYLVASGSLPPGVPTDFYARVAQRARRLGSRCVLDTSGEPAAAALRDGVFLFKPSLSEFQHLTGLADAEEPHLVEQASRLVRAGACEILLLSLGAAGALLVTPQVIRRLVSPTVPVRSTVGAGDAMLAGTILRLQQGHPVEDAVRFGLAAAAATVMNPGTELCHREDVERLYGQTAPVAA